MIVNHSKTNTTEHIFNGIYCICLWIYIFSVMNTVYVFAVKPVNSDHGIRWSFFSLSKQNYIYTYVCVCVCVCAGERGDTRARVCVCSGINELLCSDAILNITGPFYQHGWKGIMACISDHTPLFYVGWYHKTIPKNSTEVSNQDMDEQLYLTLWWWCKYS